MTLTSPVYAAFLVNDGLTDVELATPSGSITLDEGSAPHVQGTLTVATPGSWVETGTGLEFQVDTAARERMDPRQSARIRVEVDGQYPTFSIHREFDLGLRDVVDSADGGSITLSLASDEALLSDYRAGTDDAGAFAHQASLRAVVNYALSKAAPGAVLEPGTMDADMTTYSDAENIIRSPRMAPATDYIGSGASTAIDGSWPSFQDGVGHDGYRLTGNGNQDSYVSVTGWPSLSPGDWVFSASAKVNAATTGEYAARVRRLVVFVEQPGIGYVPVASDPVPNIVGNVARVSVRFTVPNPVLSVLIRMYLGATGGSITWGLPRLSKAHPVAGADNTAYFWGGKPDTAQYRYDWAGGADASTSKRTALVDRSPELLTWPAGKSALDFIHPLVQYAGLRLVCDENRKWTLRDAEYVEPGTLNVRYGVNMKRGRAAIRRDAGLWFDAQVTIYEWDDYTGARRREVDYWSLTPNPVKVNEVTVNAPYPGPGRSQYAVQRAQGRGRELSLTLQADWRVKAEQRMTAVLPDQPIQTGEVSSVTLNLDTDDMDVTSRSTDTPALAWVLGPDDLQWNDVTPGLTWAGMDEWSDA